MVIKSIALKTKQFTVYLNIPAKHHYNQLRQGAVNDLGFHQHNKHLSRNQYSRNKINVNK